MRDSQREMIEMLKRQGKRAYFDEKNDRIVVLDDITDRGDGPLGMAGSDFRIDNSGGYADSEDYSPPGGPREFAPGDVSDAAFAAKLASLHGSYGRQDRNDSAPARRARRPERADDRGDALYLDEAAWAAHCASFHGKFGEEDGGTKDDDQ